MNLLGFHYIFLHVCWLMNQPFWFTFFSRVLPLFFSGVGTKFRLRSGPKGPKDLPVTPPRKEKVADGESRRNLLSPWKTLGKLWLFLWVKLMGINSNLFSSSVEQFIRWGYIKSFHERNSNWSYLTRLCFLPEEEGFVEGVAGFSGGLWSINYLSRWDFDWPPFAVAVFGKDTNNIVYSDALFQGTAKDTETSI